MTQGAETRKRKIRIGTRRHNQVDVVWKLLENRAQSSENCWVLNSLHVVKGEDGVAHQASKIAGKSRGEVELREGFASMDECHGKTAEVVIEGSNGGNEAAPENDRVVLTRREGQPRDVGGVLGQPLAQQRRLAGSGRSRDQS